MRCPHLVEKPAFNYVGMRMSEAKYACNLIGPCDQPDLECPARQAKQWKEQARAALYDGLSWPELMNEKTRLILVQRAQGCTIPVANQIATLNVALRAREQAHPEEVVCDE